MPLNWLGHNVSAKMKRAQIAGVNATMAAAVVHAKQNHTWQNQSGTLEGSIDIQDYARELARGGVGGTWGSRDALYALIHELGGTITPVAAEALVIPDGAGGVAAIVQSVEIPARPYLRPAGDAEYPRLADRIRNAYENEGTL